MRTRYEPEEQQEFDNGCAVLASRLGAWAVERGLPCDPMMLSALLEYRHLATVDGRLGRWEPQHVEEALLSWLPQVVTEPPGEDPADGPGTLRTLIAYLHNAGLNDPLGPPPQTSLAAVDSEADHYRDAMSDRARWGLAKFWATTAAESGVDLTNAQAMQEFTVRAQHDEVDHDETTLAAIMERRLTGRMLSPDARSFSQLPVVLPAESSLREQAARVPVLDQLRALADWAGREGRAVTSTGRLRLADARALVEQLGTGDPADAVRSSADLPQLGLLVEWAKKARLVRVAKGRMYAVAKAEPLMSDPLALWLRCFASLPELREQLLGARSGWHVESMLFDDYEPVLADMLNTLYSLPHPMPWPRLRESVQAGYRESLALSTGAPSAHRAWLDHADRDLRRVLDVLTDLGALERRQGMADPVFLEAGLGEPPSELSDELPEDVPPELAAVFAEALGLEGPDDAAAEAREHALREELSAGPVELITLTPLGTRAVRERLLAEGRHVPLVGELAQVPPTGLLGALAEDYTPEAAATELEGWLGAHGDRADGLRRLTEAVRRMPFHGRAQAMLVVLLTGLPEPEGERLLRELRGDERLAPLALSVLCEHDVLGVDDLTEREGLLVMAEGLLQFVELSGGPDPEGGAPEALREQGPQLADAVAAALASDHPDKGGLEELRHLVEEA